MLLTSPSMEGAPADEPQQVSIGPWYRLASNSGASSEPRRRRGSWLSARSARRRVESQLRTAEESPERLLRSAPLVLLATTLIGCAAWNQAFRDRVSEEKPTVRFGCAAFLQEPELSKPTIMPRIAVFLRGAPDPDPPIVGELFQWGQERIPVLVAGRSPNAVLLTDAKSLLVRLGHRVTNEASSAAARIDLDIVRLGAGQKPARLFELRGTTVAQIGLRVRLTRRSESARTWELSQEAEIKSVYFLASDMERALDHAYCRLLADLDALFRSPDFRASA